MKMKISAQWLQGHRLVVSCGLTLVVGILGYKTYETMVQNAVDPVLVPVAAKYLKSGTVISE